MQSNATVIRILLVESDPEEARGIQEMLAEAEGVTFDLVCADRLSKGVERIAQGGIDLILLDLSLSDSQGLATFNRMYIKALETPIVVLGSVHEKGVGITTLREGAYDYLVKEQMDSDLLKRSVSYTLERRRLRAEEIRAEVQAKTARIKELEQELRLLEHLARPGHSLVTAGLYGAAALYESLPEAFNELVQSYGDLMDIRLEEQAYKVKSNSLERFNAIVQRLGFLKAGPRDVVDIHTSALKSKTRKANSEKVQAYIAEGRLIVLELMGYLVSYYRNYSLGVRRANQTSSA